MKVSVTFELNDDQRIAIGLGETGEFKPATRKEAANYLEVAGMLQVYSITQVVTEHRKKIADEIKAKLDE